MHRGLDCRLLEFARQIQNTAQKVCWPQAELPFSHLSVEKPPGNASLAEFESSFIINSTTWEAAVKAIANADKQLLFSTFQGPNDDMLQMSANFYAWMHASQLSNNVLYLSEDMQACQMLWQFGLPCWYDDLCPRGEDLPPGTALQAHLASLEAGITPAKGQLFIKCAGPLHRSV